MMGEVRRFNGVPHNSGRPMEVAADGDYVLAEDYDALKAENTRLREALGSIVDKYFDLPHEFRLGPARLKESRESLIAREALKEQV